jgi:hypothetical protein
MLAPNLTKSVNFYQNCGGGSFWQQRRRDIAPALVIVRSDRGALSLIQVFRQAQQ